MARFDLSEAALVDQVRNFPAPLTLHYNHCLFKRLTFHPMTHGTSIRLSSDCTIAARYTNNCDGIIMSSRNIAPGDSFVVQIGMQDSTCTGSLEIGFTTCDPATLFQFDLPKYARDLVDRPEYWVFSKFGSDQLLLGDEIEFHLSCSGVVTMRRNCREEEELMHVDVSQPLWAVFDLHGSTKTIRTFGIIDRPIVLSEKPTHVIPRNEVSGVLSFADPQPKLQFHFTRGKNVELSGDRSTARRVLAQGDGIAFSSRPVRPNEKVHLRFVDLSSIRGDSSFLIGFTSLDPATLCDASSEYVCSGLRKWPGFWTHRLTTEPKTNMPSTTLSILFTESGAVMLSVCETSTRKVLDGLDTRSPLWLVVDFWGKASEVQFTANNGNFCYTSTNGLLTANRPPNLLATLPAPVVMRYTPAAPPLRHYNDRTFEPLAFHQEVRGANVRMSSDCCTAVYCADCNCGIVMSVRPITPGETWVLQVIECPSFFGTMKFGFTACSPASLTSTELPNTADEFLDRPEYWSISDCGDGKQKFGEEIEFHLSNTGVVTARQNGREAREIMHVDVSQPIWVVYFLSNFMRAVRLLGTIAAPRAAEQNDELQKNDEGVPPQKMPEIHSDSECLVCCLKPIDSVLYPCGHMCLCYDCGKKIHTAPPESSGECPICRGSIRDVIRTFRS